MFFDPTTWTVLAISLVVVAAIGFWAATGNDDYDNYDDGDYA